ncbi:MAG: hypothetical protein U0326_37430 [Polyangiales bacterium]
MKRAWTSRVAALALLCASVSCAKYPTSIFVRLSADPEVRAAIRTAVVRTYNGDDTNMMAQPISEQILPLTSMASEYTFLVTRTTTNKRVRIEVEVYTTSQPQGGRDPGAILSYLRSLMPGMGITNDRVIVTWVEDTALQVSMQLRNACTAVGGRSMPCPPTQRCTSTGTCAEATQNNASTYNY